MVERPMWRQLVGVLTIVHRLIIPILPWDIFKLILRYVQLNIQLVIKTQGPENTNPLLLIAKKGDVIIVLDRELLHCLSGAVHTLGVVEPEVLLIPSGHVLVPVSQNPPPQEKDIMIILQWGYLEGLF